MPGPAILLFVVMAVVAIVAGVISHRAAMRRREVLASLAADLGIRFDPGRDTSHDDKYAQFEVFRRGHSRAAYNTLAGDVEIDGRSFHLRMGDFTYRVTRTTGKSTTTTTHRFSYLIVHLPFPRVPDLVIRREGVLDRIAGAFGIDDIDFESAEFSRRFHVKSPDKRYAYDVVHPRMMDFLLAGDPDGINIENRHCCVTDGRNIWTPEEFRRRLKWLTEFFDLWPNHLTSDLDRRPGPR